MYKTNESGRSMVEMLGVLAIIGVLSVGGVAGFNLAMNKHCANNTVVYVNQLAVQGTSQMLMGVKPSLGQYPDKTPSGYPSTLTTEETNPNAFYVKISQVPSAVCKQILGLQKGWQAVNDIGFYNGATTCDDKENVDMWFEIKSSLNKENENVHCKSHQDCYNWLGYEARCSPKGICLPYCGENQVQTPVGCCDKNRVFNGGCCISDVIEENGIKKCCAANTDVSICCPENEWGINIKGVLSCISCDDPRALDSGFSWGYCKVCPNRLRNANQCALGCADPYAVKTLSGYCYCPMDRPVQTSDGKCHPCHYEERSSAQPVIGMLTLRGQGMIHYCNRRGSVFTWPCNDGEVGMVKNDTLTMADGSTYTATTTEGACLACDTVDISKLPYQAQCESCGGHWDGENWYSGVCVPKETT